MVNRLLSKLTLLVLLVAVTCLVIPVGGQTPAPTFQSIGQMPGTTIGTVAFGLSGDGKVVVGYAWISGSATRPWRWTAAGGFEDLGNLGMDSSNGIAYGVNHDGSVVVGQSKKPDQNLAGFRWVSGVGIAEVSPLRAAMDVTADGSMVVGGGLGIHWWKVTGETGTFGGSTANAVSADGQAAAGQMSNPGGGHAFRWTSSGGIQDLGVTTGTESIGVGMSADGQVVVGEARDAQGFWRAFRWTAALGMRDMGTTGGPMSSGYDASADGSVIVGKSLINSMSSSNRAYRWTPATGMRDLRQELLDAGVTEVQDWILYGSAAVSDDGTVIAGWGRSPAGARESWIVTYPSGGGVTLSSLTLTPTSVTGGNPSTGTATLSSAAPAEGQIVTLGSSHVSVATVPSSVTVSAGATSANFTVTTSTVATATTVIISATSGGVTKTADLTVSPGGGGGGSGDTGMRSPTANAVNSGGDGNGFESSPANAHADDALNAVDTNSGTGSSTSCTSTSKDKHRFSNYGFTFPAGVSIRGIEVRLDAKADSTSSSPKMCVQVSWDGGTTWTSTKSTPTLGTAMGTFALGSATDTWGRAWATGDFTDANFRVRVINVSSSSSRDFSLDWVAVRVHYQ